jgi:homoserine kinase
MRPHPDLRPVALIPDLRVSTARARAALPDEVPRRDAVFNVAHGALTVRALTEDPELLRVAMRDRLHEDARLELVPGARDVLDELRRRGVPVCLSGAGPTLLAFESEDRPVADPGQGWRVLRTAPRIAGFEVRSA